MKIYITQNQTSSAHKGYLIGQDDQAYIRYKAYGFENPSVVNSNFMDDRNITGGQTTFLLTLDKGEKSK